MLFGYASRCSLPFTFLCLNICTAHPREIIRELSYYLKEGAQICIMPSVTQPRVVSDEISHCCLSATPNSKHLKKKKQFLFFFFSKNILGHVSQQVILQLIYMTARQNVRKCKGQKHVSFVGGKMNDNDIIFFSSSGSLLSASVIVRSLVYNKEVLSVGCFISLPCRTSPPDLSLICWPAQQPCQFYSLLPGSGFSQLQLFLKRW